MKYNLLGAVSTIALGAAFGIGTPGAANAALTCTNIGNVNALGSFSCTETVTLGPLTTDFTNVALAPLDKWTANNTILSVVQTLKDAKYTLGGTLNSAGQVTNSSAGTQSFSFALGENFTFSSGAGAPSNFLPVATKVHASSTPVNYTLAQNASAPFSTALVLGPLGPTVRTTNLAQWTGPGVFSALVSTITSQIITGGGGNTGATLTTTGSPTITLTYDFTTSQPPPPPSPTPEPASLALLGAGLAGLGAVRRRRKS